MPNNSNTEKTLKNSSISVLAQVLKLLLLFINRRIFIVFLDIEYLGYQSLFSNVFSLLSVAELGIGNIIAFHLYKEIVQGNEKEIGKLMYLYKWLYRIVAAIVCVAGLVCYFFLPYFIKDATASWDYLHLIYFLQLGSVVFGYFLSYKQTIFIATQQEYKCVQTELFVNIGVQIIQLITLAVFRDYIIYLCFYLSTSIITNIIISRRANREFPYIKEKYCVKKEDIKKRNMFADLRDFLIHKISYAIYGGTDNVIISAFCGVRTIGLYGNYTTIKTGMMQVLFYKLLNPVQATIGNIIYSDRDKEELWEQFEMQDVFSFFFASVIGIGFFIFYQPFIQLWMGIEYLLPNSFVALFSLTIYLGAVWEIVYKYRSVFGDYKQDRWLMLLSAILNIAISIPGAKYMGVTGVELGTLIAFLPIAYGRIRFVVKNYFGKSIIKYLLKHGVLTVIAAMEALLCLFITQNFPITILGLLERGVVVFFLPIIVNALLYWRNPHFRGLMGYVRKTGIIVMKKMRRK